MKVSPVFAVVIALGLITPATAEDDEHVTTVGSIRIIHAWVRAAQAGADTLAFLDIENGGAPDRLVAVASDDAASARVVGMTMTDGQASVQEVGALDIGAGDTVLDPGGLAIELTGLKTALAEGAETEVELTFERAGSVHVHADILAPDAAQHPHAGHVH